MVIYFLRHAIAGQPFGTPKKDEKRGLDKEGIDQCGLIGRFFCRADVQVEAIVSSRVSCRSDRIPRRERDGLRRKNPNGASVATGRNLYGVSRLVEKHRPHDAILVVGTIEPG